eukprot:m.109790 g.109790  ORF g.109790 m.109790 type:complete len:100 (+) comp37371_c0_seq11:412-711(+)
MLSTGVHKLFKHHGIVLPPWCIHYLVQENFMRALLWSKLVHRLGKVFVRKTRTVVEDFFQAMTASFQSMMEADGGKHGEKQVSFFLLKFVSVKLFTGRS